MRCALRTSIFLLLLAPLGCGGPKGPSIVPVAGRVTLDGKPLGGAVVRFQPLNKVGGPLVNPDSFAKTDENGHYTLKPISNRENEDGAIVGKHVVQISLFDVEAGGGGRERVPSQYSQGNTLTLEVPPQGTTEANFDLKSK